ncbi:MAG: hypothetical protein GXC94_02105 [Comamonadaceae bacterium]|nr:hypothetical protein [Comamonadaceae bacterium]
MSKALSALAWQDTCIEGVLQWVEHQAPSGDWLRIKKKRLGGFLVTRFGPDKMLKEAEAELSSEELEAVLAPAPR